MGRLIEDEASALLPLITIPGGTFSSLAAEVQVWV